MDIMQHVARRAQRRSVRREVRDVANQLVAAARRYAGGSPAERDSHSELRVRLKSQLRASYFAGVGRCIDLVAMLQQLAQDGDRLIPAWAMIDPRRPIGSGNESHAMHEYNGSSIAWRRSSSGQYAKGISVGGAFVPVQYDCTVKYDSAMSGYQSLRAKGIPALPSQIRRLLADPRLKQASMVGLLYQPDAWMQVNPDPAIIVEWTDLPGQYYCLAVWGVDGPAIMEFVD